MENMIFSIKRKKRRTRRCLDEIRNRLRSKNKFNFIKPGSRNIKFRTEEFKKTDDRLVTVNRLTLKAMFPNAITSDTITRPILEEIKQKQSISLADVIKDSTVNTANQHIDDRKVCFSSKINTSASFDNNIPLEQCNGNSQSGENSNCKTCEAKCSNSILLFSPSGSIDKPITQSKPVNGLISSKSPPENTQDYQHHTNMVKEIPFYCRHLASSSNREDSTITNLQALDLERCQAEYDPNIMKCDIGHDYSNESFQFEDEVLVENPLDYLRIEHDRQQNHTTLHVALLESSGNEGEKSGESTTGESGKVRSPSASDYDFHFNDVPYDTPDYNYFPHCLK